MVGVACLLVAGVSPDPIVTTIARIGAVAIAVGAVPAGTGVATVVGVAADRASRCSSVGKSKRLT